MDYIHLLKKRYATKAMNGRVVPDESIENILEAIRLLPTLQVVYNLLKYL